MYLAEVRLWNFRRFGSKDEEVLDVDQPHLRLKLKPGLNVFVGANDSGKSAVIDAIKLVLKTHSYDWIRIESSDFHRMTKEFRIELIIKGMDSGQAKNFTEWLGWEGEGHEAESYLKLIYKATRTDDRIIPGDVKAGPDQNGKSLSAEAREYLKSTYLKPLRDAKAELIAKRGSRLSQILRGHSAFKGKEGSHHLLKGFEALNNEIKKYFEGKKTDGTNHHDQEGRLLKEKVDEFVEAFIGEGMSTDINASDGDLISILERLEISILDYINPGLGTLNRLFMGTELVHLSRDPWTGLRMGLIEEMEAHLNPQAQMQVVEKLQSEQNIQLLLTTHSPNLASKVKLENLIIFSGNAALSLASKYTRLEDEDYVFLEKFLDVTKSNLFFAQGVILIEGWAEEILISSIARRMGYDLTKKGISVVNVGSTALLRYSKIFARKSNNESTNIPVAVVTDVDIRHYITNDNKEVVKVDSDGVVESTAKKKRQLEEKFNIDNVKAFIASDWTLEYSLYKSPLFKEAFMEAVKKVHSGTNWSDFEGTLATKLINKRLKKTEIAYELARRLDGDASRGEGYIKALPGDSMGYLLNAIKYVCKNDNY